MVAANVEFRGKSVTIACIDLAASARFYEEVLGAKLQPGDGYGCRWYKLGELSFSLMANAQERARFPEQAMPMLWVETNDLEAAEEKLSELQVEVLQASDGQMMIVADPDGIPIEVWQASNRG